MKRLTVLLFGLTTLTFPAEANNAQATSREAKEVLSADFRNCFGPNAPLDAESYDCLDREFRRLGSVLTKEYRAALALQPNNAARTRLVQDERKWWRIRFKHCRDDVGDLRGSTAAVINQNCEIEALARRIVGLRHYGR